MTWVEYPYTSIWSDDKILKKPILNIVVGKNGKVTPQAAIIDSGADIALMSSEIAEMLGIRAHDCEKKFVSGIDSVPLEGFVADVEVQVAGIAGIIKIPVLFIPGLQFNNLLGQYGFFEYFHVRFDKDRDIFALMKAPRKKKSYKFSPTISRALKKC
jgi:hypothetical protein